MKNSDLKLAVDINIKKNSLPVIYVLLSLSLVIQDDHIFYL